MLPITIPKEEGYDNINKMFIDLPEVKLQLEHSLISISKWESIYHKPFLSSDKTTEEVYMYIKCMVIGKDVDLSTIKRIKTHDIKRIQKYIDDPMTATWFSENGKRVSNKRKKKVITNELIYYWMSCNQIPFECEKWHLNRLLTLLEICAIENDASQKKMSKREILSQNARINSARRAALRNGSKPKIPKV